MSQQQVTNDDMLSAVTTLIHWCAADIDGVQLVLGEAVNNDRLLPVTLGLLQAVRSLCPELAGDENLATLRHLAAQLTALTFE